jgi:membrane-associated phospholipid phosphatase
MPHPFLLVFFFEFITDLGSPQSLTMMCAALVLFLGLRNKPHHLIQFIIFMSATAASVLILKDTLQIPRPLGGIIYEYGYGFPSGHAAMAMIFFPLVYFAVSPHIKKHSTKVVSLVFVVAMVGLISYSRVYLGVHTWADIAGGLSLGGFWFGLSILFYNCLERSHHALHARHINHEKVVETKPKGVKRKRAK